MKLLIDPNYNPDLQDTITSATKLGSSVTCAKFLGSKGSRTQFEKLYSDNYQDKCDRFQIARNLTLHARLLESLVGLAEFANHRIIVSEGIYEPNPKFEVVEQPAGSEESAKKIVKSKGGSYGKGSDGWVVRTTQYTGEKAGGINLKRRTGEAIVYQLIGIDGKTDPRKTYDLAVYWSDYADYDKLTLDYDTFDPNGDLTCQIVVETPKVPKSYDVKFDYKVATTYNGALQSEGDLIEILPE